MQDTVQAGISLRGRVREAYSAAAQRPEEKHPFPVGRAFAQSVGYPAEWLDKLPEGPAEVFAGVSNVGVQAPVTPGMKVLDLGCGGGLDSLILQRRMQGSGWVIGLDFSAEMLSRAKGVIRVRASGEQMPFPDSCVDLAVVNGLFNLNPFREEIIRELARVVRPGGQVFGAELVLRKELPVTFRSGDANWFS